MAFEKAQESPKAPGFYYPGPVARAYEKDFSHRKTFIAGPTGGGKTFSSSRKCLNATLNQKPSIKDGVRRAKIVVICPTYPIMENTVLASFRKVFPEGRGRKWTGSNSRPQDFLYKAQTPDGAKLDMFCMFRALSDLDYDEFFRGLECSFFWLPEADTSLNKEMMGYLANRWGREYLDHVKDGEQLSSYGVFGDSNIPFVGTFFHELFYLKLTLDEVVVDKDGNSTTLGSGGLKLYRQPAGFDPTSPDGWPRDALGNILAENHRMLLRQSKRYYLEKAADQAGIEIPSDLMAIISSDKLDLMAQDAGVKRLLMCIPTSQRFGLPVHEVFDPDFHCTSMRLTPDPYKRVFVGIDTGLTPGAVFYQRQDWGQWRAIKEIAPLGFQMDLVELGQGIKRVLNEDFGGAPGGVLGCIDPAGKRALADNKNVQEWQIVAREAGIPMQFPASNEHNVRKMALDRLLKAPGRRQNGKSEPMYLVSRHGCPQLVRALSGGYAYKKRGETVTPEVDKKNPFSHIAEAAQYAPLVVEGIDGLGKRFSHQSDQERAAKKGVQVTRTRRY